MSDLPESWIAVSILQLSSFIRGVTYGRNDAQDEPRDGYMPVLRATNITNRGFDLAELVYIPDRLISDDQRLRLGDVLVATSSGSVSVVGKAQQVKKPVLAAFGAFCGVLRPSESLDAHYFGHFFGTHEYRHIASSSARGVNINNLKQDDFAAITLPLAPLSEQRRIADKLDALLARVDPCRERLDRVPIILKRFRQAVLAAATSGRLTEDWRGESRSYRPPHASTEDLQEFTFEDAECFGAYGFPSSWGISRLHEIADVDGGITKDTKKQNPLDEELPYLRVANVQRGFLDLSEVKTIRVPSQRVEELLLKPGDILFNEGGDLDKLGRGWVWSGEIERCTFQNHVFRVRLHDTSFVPKFFSWYGNSRGFDYFVKAGKQTTNLASINKTLLSALPVVVPPSDEQHEIVRRVEALFVHADRLEARYQAARAQVEHLTPSLLAKAFRGELVPQDPNDEPASELLEQIRAARASAAIPTKQRRRRPPMKLKIKTGETAAGSAGIVKALGEAQRELSGQELLTEAGYAPDADPESVEAFFVAVRDALNEGQIIRQRRDDMDWFSLAL